MISQVAAGIDIGDGLTCIINHRIGQYAASLDIRKAYRQILSAIADLDRFPFISIPYIYFDVRFPFLEVCLRIIFFENIYESIRN